MAAEIHKTTQSIDCASKKTPEAMQKDIQLINSQIVLDSADVASSEVFHVEAENTDYVQQLKTTPNPVFNNNTEVATSSSTIM